MMSTGAAFVVLGGAFAGGFVSGLAGFGNGLVALGIWLHVLQPAPAATLVAVCAVVAQAQTLPAIWHAFDRARTWPMVAAGLLGVPLGTFLLAYINLDAFRLAVGILLLAYSGFMLLGSAQRIEITWGGSCADAIVGFGGGILGGLAGLSGPLPTIWATLRGWGKDAGRAVFQAFNLTILAGTVAVHAAAGLITVELGQLLVLALPGTVLGAWLGASAYQRLSDRHFDQIVLGLLGISGLTLVFASSSRW